MIQDTSHLVHFMFAEWGMVWTSICHGQLSTPSWVAWSTRWYQVFSTLTVYVLLSPGSGHMGLVFAMGCLVHLHRQLALLCTTKSFSLWNITFNIKNKMAYCPIGTTIHAILYFTYFIRVLYLAISPGFPASLPRLAASPSATPEQWNGYTVQNAESCDNHACVSGQSDHYVACTMWS